MHTILSFLYGRWPLLCLLALSALGLYALGWAVLCRVRRRNGRPLPTKPQLLLGLLLFLWLAGVLGVTLLLPRVGGPPNFTPFRAWWNAWIRDSSMLWSSLILNILLFLPLGVLLPLCFRRVRRGLPTVGTGFLLSLVIELLQYVTHRGFLDVDDLMLNTLGTFLGWCLFALCWNLLHHRRRWLSYALPPLACILLFCGFFLSGEQAEFGKLSIFTPFPKDMGQVEIQVECPLPDEVDPAAVYYLPALTEQTCDEAASPILAGLGLAPEAMERELDELQCRYDSPLDAPVRGTLTLFLGNHGFYLQRLGEERPDTAEASQETLEAALEAYGVRLPAETVLSQEDDGSYTFQAKKQWDADGYYEGMLNCAYCADGQLWSIQNDLIQAEVYGQRPIYSPAGAVEQLKAGHFYGPRLEERIADGPKTVTVQAISLTYKEDSKGFYQPVYVLLVDAAEAYIPALPR